MKANKRPHATWLKCARFISHVYEPPRLPVAVLQPANFIQLVQQMERLRRQQAMAAERNWAAAERQLLKDRRRQLTRIRNEADKELEVERDVSGFELSEFDLFRDLLVLNQEFATVVFDAKAKRLSAVTKDITLEGFQFGAFNIVLHLDSLGNSRPNYSKAYYEVLAVDPRPAASSEGVTHPHVDDNRLCEGEALPTIRLALKQGRILDFFQIVEQVLGTYNPSSAYVAIREWRGVLCGHCGYTSNRDESRECECCEAMICESCVYQCSDCEDYICGNCERSCRDCAEPVCNGCVAACAECDEKFCSGCLNEDERCDACEKKVKEETD